MHSYKEHIGGLFWEKFLSVREFGEQVERYYVSEKGQYAIIWTNLRIFFGHDSFGLIAVQQDPWGLETILHE